MFIRRKYSLQILFGFPHHSFYKPIEMWGFCWAEDELNIEFIVGHFFSAYLFPGEVDLFVSPNKVSASIANNALGFGGVAYEP